MFGVLSLDEKKTSAELMKISNFEFTFQLLLEQFPIVVSLTTKSFVT